MGIVRQQLARWGLTHQVFKSALAASASYALAAAFVDHRFPFFAPMAALLTIQVTIFNSYSRGLQRILAIIMGVGIALIAFHFTGVNWWIIFVVTLATLMLGTRIGLGIAAINQVPMSALLILASKAFVPTYALYRIVDTVLGTVVAVVVNIFLWPPNSLPQAEHAVDQLAQKTVTLLTEVARAVSESGREKTGPKDLMTMARDLDKLVGTTLTSVNSAQQSLRFNPHVRQLNPLAEQYRQLTLILERVGVQSRGIAKSVSELLPAPLPEAEDLSELLHTAAEQVNLFMEARTKETAEARPKADAAFAKSRRLYRQIAQKVLAAYEQEYHDTWTRYGAILADVHHMLQELADTLHSF